MADQCPVDVLRRRVDECRAVGEDALEHGGLRADELEHLPDGHAGGKAVGVHDEIGPPAALREGHVLLRHDEPHDALLTVAGGELVAWLWPSGLAGDDLVDRHPLGIAREYHPVDVGGHRVLVAHRRRLVLSAAIHAHDVLRLHGRQLVRQDVAVLDLLAGPHHAVLTQSAVADVLRSRAAPLVVRVRGGRGREQVPGPVLVCGEGHDRPPHHVAPSEATVQCSAVHDDGVLDVVAAVRHHGDRGVLAGPQVVEIDQIQRLARAQRLLWVRQAE
mmetsp:Transcript_106398/g.297936  ORF Transcript_106398/g.297936 Transcript_106398/m.297936 type:complete len:274 (-) Transcript_106398:2409-3230(-)